MSNPPLSVDALLETAREVDTGLIRQLALRIKAGAAELDTAITAEKRVRRLTALRREVAHLETTLAKPHPGRVNGGHDRVMATTYDPAMIRAWAKDHWTGKVPAQGRYLPDDLVAAYRLSEDQP